LDIVPSPYKEHLIEEHLRRISNVRPQRNSYAALGARVRHTTLPAARWQANAGDDFLHHSAPAKFRR
jgi:hypothetical protein